MRNWLQGQTSFLKRVPSPLPSCLVLVPLQSILHPLLTLSSYYFYLPNAGSLNYNVTGISYLSTQPPQHTNTGQRCREEEKIWRWKSHTGTFMLEAPGPPTVTSCNANWALATVFYLCIKTTFLEIRGVPLLNSLLHSAAEFIKDHRTLGIPLEMQLTVIH